MLNKSVKILSYSALAVTLLMGNITLPTGYFEDETNFSSIPNKLATGWGFSFNKAHADCTVSMDDCITIYGSPPPADPWTGTPEPDPQPEDPTGQEDGGGGDISTTYPPPPNLAVQKEQCVIKANSAFEQCITTSKYKSNTIYNNCIERAGVVDIPYELIGGVKIGEIILHCSQKRDDYKYALESFCNKDKEDDLLQCTNIHP